MEFKKGQRLQSPNMQGYVYRVESGPWPGLRGVDQYLLERVGGPVESELGRYTLLHRADLSPLPPQVGDRGRRGGHSFPPRRIREINDDYVVTEATGEIGAKYVIDCREHFDRVWEPES